MHHLLNVKRDSIKSFWTRNFQLDQKKLSFAAYVDMLKGSNNFSLERKLLHQECVDAYESFMECDDDNKSE